MAKTGKTTGNLKMRSGPGMEFEPPIAFLVPDTELEILGEQGDWWQVRHGGKEGYVGKKYVAVSDSPAPAPAKEAAPSTAGISAATISLSGGREASSAASSDAQPGGREAGERGHTVVDEK